MDSIQYNFIDVEIPDFHPEFFDLWLLKVSVHFDRTIKELTYVFCSDNYLLEMNKTHLNHDYFTDVITFNYNDKDSLAGDVFVSYERVVDNARVYGNGKAKDELCRVMVHGLLHLIGFDDKTEEDREEMRRAEELSLRLR